MNSTTILIDGDGVLIDFLGSFLPMANQISGLDRKFEDVVEWDVLKIYPKEFHMEIRAAMGKEGFCSGMQPIPGALKALAVLSTMGHVVVVTAPSMTKTWCWERTMWLKRHADFSPKEVIFADAKHHVRGNVLIDDKYETLVEWKRHNPDGDAILWHAPYNAHIHMAPDIWRARSWDDVITLVKASQHLQQETLPA